MFTTPEVILLYSTYFTCQFLLSVFSHAYLRNRAPELRQMFCATLPLSVAVLRWKSLAHRLPPADVRERHCDSTRRWRLTADWLFGRMTYTITSQGLFDYVTTTDARSVGVRVNHVPINNNLARFGKRLVTPRAMGRQT